MSLSRWKELAQRKTKAGRAVNELYDDITVGSQFLADS